LFYSFFVNIQGDQKVSVHLMITIQSSASQRLFDHPLYAINSFENFLPVSEEAGRRSAQRSNLLS